METQKIMKISEIIDVLNEVLALPNAYLVLKHRLAGTLHKELKQHGSHAQILGKDIHANYYASVIDKWKQSKGLHDVITFEEREIHDQLIMYIDKMNEAIDSLKVSQNIRHDDETHKALLKVIGGNSSIEGGEVITFKPGQNGIMIYPFAENGILLTKNDLNQLLKVINLQTSNGADSN